MMNPEDISKFYYCFTKAGGMADDLASNEEEKFGFYGEGLFYKYL